MHQPFSKPTVIAAICATLLAACGGNDNHDAPAPAPTPEPAVRAISGKAIDGYLVGATVCLDLNANLACDAGEPTATTDANGTYTLPYADDASGKRVLVQVTPATRDLSRPAGFVFPASYSLSAILDSNLTQHVTPLTTMITAQMEAGMSRAEAIAAVQGLFGGTLDLNADYVANGDVTTSAIAVQLVDKLTELATDGKIDVDTIRKVLNAIVTKGDIASVTQSDVDAEAAKPVYRLTDASQVLASPVYGLVGEAFSPIQSIQQIVDGALQTKYQQNRYDFNNDTPLGFEDMPVNEPIFYTEPRKQFMMKADGSWTEMLTPAQVRAPQPLASIGAMLTGTDPLSGIAFTYEERQADLSNQPARLAVNGTALFGADVSSYAPLENVTLPAGTQAFLGIQSYLSDRVILPMETNMNCQVPYRVGSECPLNYSGIFDPNTPVNDPALPSPLASVRQLVGETIVEPLFSQTRIQIKEDGTARIELMNGDRSYQRPSAMRVGGPLADMSYPVVSAKWRTLESNPNVMVFELSSADAKRISDLSWSGTVLATGAKLALAVRNGQLHSGMMFPAGYSQRTVQFANTLPGVLTAVRPQ